jgi:hypothetical protein
MKGDIMDAPFMYPSFDLADGDHLKVGLTKSTIYSIDTQHTPCTKIPFETCLFENDIKNVVTTYGCRFPYMMPERVRHVVGLTNVSICNAALARKLLIVDDIHKSYYNVSTCPKKQGPCTRSRFDASINTISNPLPQQSSSFMALIGMYPQKLNRL